MKDIFCFVVFHCSLEVPERLKAYSQYSGILKFTCGFSLLFVEQSCLTFQRFSEHPAAFCLVLHSAKHGHKLIGDFEDSRVASFFRRNPYGAVYEVDLCPMKPSGFTDPHASFLQ
jgi:hypothetical protein